MDNKETLQQNNTRINVNNEELASILITINNLPTAKEEKLQDKVVEPSTTEQTITADEEYTGLGSVTVNAVTNEIDSNIVAENIRDGVEILGVTGTLHEGITPGGELTINDNGVYDVTNYASANVEIEKGITPSGTLEINENGEYDVKSYEKANVNIEEDLTNELTEQDRLITYQENSLLDVVSKLQGKTGGTSSTVTIKEHYLEGTVLNIVLSNGQILTIDLRVYVDDDHPDTVAEIEQLIVSRLENKTIEEVEQ